MQSKRTEETRRLLIGDLKHRVKNTLASVQAIANQTLRHTQSPADFAAKFTGRIQALARAHSSLSSAPWQGANLKELIQDQCQLGTLDEARLTALGPSVELEKLGRASGRERVCQYVQIPVVGGSVKKKSV